MYEKYRTGPCPERFYNLVKKRDIKQELKETPNNCTEMGWCGLLP